MGLMQSRVGWALVVLIAAVLFGLAGWFAWSAPKLGAGERLGASQSGGQSPDVAQSFEGLVAQSGAETVMSGGYEVGVDGKLLRPKDVPTPAVPVPPDAMRYETPEGMEAFARYVLEVQEYTWMSGDTSKLEAISLPDCVWCQDNVRQTQTRTIQGEWITGLDITVVAFSPAGELIEEPHVWQIIIDLEQTSFLYYDGNEVKAYSPHRGSIVIQARYEKGNWKIREAGKPRADE